MIDTILIIFDFILNLIPSYLSYIKKSKIFLTIKKNFKIIKLIMLTVLISILIYKIYFLGIKEDKVNLNFKLLSYFFSIVLVINKIFFQKKDVIEKSE